MRREWPVVAALWAACAAWAQQAPDFLPGVMGKPAAAAEWKEGEVPPPPALRADNRIPVDVPGSFDLRYGIDPASVGVGQDAVVRFVVVATSRSGALNATYEGVRCDRGEYRVYARSSGQDWHAADAEWKPMDGGSQARQALAIAKAGVCRGNAPNGSVSQILRDLRAPFERKFGGSGSP